MFFDPVLRAVGLGAFARGERSGMGMGYDAPTYVGQGSGASGAIYGDPRGGFGSAGPTYVAPGTGEARGREGPPPGMSPEAWAEGEAYLDRIYGRAGLPRGGGVPPAPPRWAPEPGYQPTPEDYLYTLPDGRQVPWIPFINPYEQGQIAPGGQTPLAAFGAFGGRAPAGGTPWGRQSPTPYPSFGSDPTPYPELSSSSYMGRQSSTPYPGFGSSPTPYPGWR